MWQALRYAVRKLIRRPSFTVIALATLALGIGVNTAIFGMVNGILLRPLPGVEAPSQVVRVYTSDYSSGPYGVSSMPDYEDYRDQATSFGELAAFAQWPSATLGLADGAERVDLGLATGNFFPMLGVRMAAGRPLLPADDEGQGAVAVISHSLWQQRFGGAPDVVGRRITLDGTDFTVVGVVGREFTGMYLGSSTDVWVPVSALAAVSLPDRWLENRGARWIEMVGRLRGGATLEEAAQQVRTIATRLADTYPNTNMGTLQDADAPRPMTLVPAGAARVGPDNRPTMVKAAWLLMGVVVLVLLIACANLANLLLARARSREREIAVRLSIGASRSQIVRQLLAESVILGGAGGLVGLGVALWLNDLLIRFTPQRVVDNLGLGGGLQVDGRVLVFTLVVALAAGVLFGLAPALQARATDLVQSLKEGGSTHAGGRRRIGSKDTLVVSQVAMALMLLVGTGLMVRSLRSTLAVDPGFDLDRALITDVVMNDRYDPANGPAFLDELARNIEALPGVRGATYAMLVPVRPGGARRGASIPGYEPGQNESMEINFNLVGPDYFSTMGIDLLAGRSFQAGDSRDAAPVAVVNRAFADRYFRGADPVGRYFRWGSGCDDCNPESADAGGIRIVGMVANGKYRSLRETPLPYIYQPMAQAYSPSLSLVVATAGEPTAVAGAVRNTVNAMDATLPLSNLRTMHQHLGSLVAAETAITTLVGGFGILALLLAALGIYGVMSFIVADRTREIGLRMALGARAPGTLGRFLRRGLALTAAGLAIGMVLAAGVSRLVESFLFEIPPFDPLVYAGTAAVLALAATAATAIPAARATRVNPMVALRDE